MDTVKFNQLKQDIDALGAQGKALTSDVEKFCLDLSVSPGEYKPLLDAFDSVRQGIGPGEYTIRNERWHARIAGREHNAKVFAEKYLGCEVTVDPKELGDRFDGIGIVSGYIRTPIDVLSTREYAYVLVEVTQNTHNLGNATAGVFSVRDKTYTFLRPVAGYYCWHSEELMLVNSTPKVIVTTGECECGAGKVGSAFHSKWCPKYK